MKAINAKYQCETALFALCRRKLNQSWRKHQKIIIVSIKKIKYQGAKIGSSVSRKSASRWRKHQRQQWRKIEAKENRQRKQQHRQRHRAAAAAAWLI